jgi:hypothetical protein
MKKLISAWTVVFLLVASSGVAARGYGYGHHGYGHHGYAHGGHNYGAHAGLLVGGLLLGSILAAPRYSTPRYAPRPHIVYVPQPVASVSHVSSAPPVRISRRLLRDINGHCFERKIDAAGTELRVQLPASDCAW